MAADLEPVAAARPAQAGGRAEGFAETGGGEHLFLGAGGENGAAAQEQDVGEERADLFDVVGDEDKGRGVRAACQFFQEAEEILARHRGRGPAHGSSRKRIFRRAIRVRPMRMRCRSPWERWHQGRSARWAAWTWRKTVAARRASAGEMRRQKLTWPSPPETITSRAVWSGSIRWPRLALTRPTAERTSRQSLAP